MSYEVFLLLQNMKQLERKLAIQCAPLLTGIKISNLLIVQSQHVRYVKELFRNTDISFFILCETSEKTTFLLYRKSELARYIGSSKAKELLLMLGYQCFDVEFLLHSLKEKYERYMEDKGAFPHELGLMLGYPVEDVYGFIVNKGQNCLLIGYWKVYENVSEKKKMFEQYNEAKETVIRLVSGGASILEIIKMHNKGNLERVAFLGG